MVPLGPKEDLESINDELIEVMKALAATHFEGHVDPNDLDSFLATPLLDIKSFRRSLSEDLREAAYHRYLKAWTCANSEPTIASSTQVDKCNKRFAAAELRREARLPKRRKIDHGDEGSRGGERKVVSITRSGSMHCCCTAVQCLRYRVQKICSAFL